MKKLVLLLCLNISAAFSQDISAPELPEVETIDLVPVVERIIESPLEKRAYLQNIYLKTNSPFYEQDVIRFVAPGNSEFSSTKDVLDILCKHFGYTKSYDYDYDSIHIETNVGIMVAIVNEYSSNLRVRVKEHIGYMNASYKGIENIECFLK